MLHMATLLLSVYTLIAAVIYVTLCSGHVLWLVNSLICISCRNAKKKATSQLGIELLIKPLIASTAVHWFTS